MSQPIEINAQLARATVEKLRGARLANNTWADWRKLAGVKSHCRKITETQLRGLLAIVLIRKKYPLAAFDTVHFAADRIAQLSQCETVNQIVNQYKNTEISGSEVLKMLVEQSGYDRASVYRRLPGFTAKQKYTVEQTTKLIAQLGKKGASSPGVTGTVQVCKCCGAAL